MGSMNTKKTESPDFRSRYAWMRLSPRRFVCLGVAGVALLICILASELLWLPVDMEPFGQDLFRIAFLVTLPFRFLIYFIIPPANHHWSVAHFAVVCLGTPYFLWIGGAAVLHIKKRFTRGSYKETPPVSVAAARVPRTLDRRDFLVRMTAGTAFTAVGGVGFYASFVEPVQLEVRRYEIPIRDLPSAFDGFRIVQVSDTHYGPYNPLRFIEKAIGMANDLQGDLVALTGDYVHFTPRSIEPGIKVLTKLTSRFGTVAVMGNHEHWEGIEACHESFKKTKMRVLNNDRVFLTPAGLATTPQPGPCLCIAGVGDLWEGQVLFQQAVRDADDNMPRIVLSHNPDAAELVGPKERIDLMIAGHTHGGQIVLPHVGPLANVSRCGEKYLGGLCQGPHCPVVVSRGVGVAGIPVRLGVHPEIGLIILKRA